MAITLADFTKIWASTSPLTPYSFGESNYKEGWNFIGGTPPARQMWDSIQKQNDEKMEYIVDNFLPLTGGTMTGKILGTSSVLGNANDTDKMFILGGTSTTDSPSIMMSPKNGDDGGVIQLQARNGSTFANLNAFPNGSLTWGGKEVERVNASGSNYIRFESGLQIVWGIINVAASSTFTYTYPVAFKETPIIATGLRWAGTNEQVSVQDDSTTSAKFNLTNAGTNNHNIFLIAIGLWK